MTQQGVIDQLKLLASKYPNKEYLTEDDIKSVPKLAYYLYQYYDSIGEALTAAGLPSSPWIHSHKLTEDQIKSYLKDLWKSLNHAPRVKDILNDNKIYKKYSPVKITWKLVRGRLNGLRNALIDISPEMGKSKQIDKSLKSDEQETPEFNLHKRRFWGVGAEHHVIAELFYHGFEASKRGVDLGLDLRADKNNKYFYIQVKHKDLDNKLPIKLTKSSFNNNGGGNVYFIFVLLSNEVRKFLIIPWHVLEIWITDGLIDTHENEFLMYITKEDDRFMLKEKDLNHYLDRWDSIK